MNTFAHIISLLLMISCIMTQNETPTKIKLGTSNRLIQTEKTCEILEIPTNYKHIGINIQKIKNFDRIIVTDKLMINGCSLSTCANDSNICQGTGGPTGSSFEISIELILEQGNENCRYTHDSSFSYCGESNIEECRSCLRPSCTVIQCGYETGRKTEEKFLCVPFATTSEEKEKRCLNFENATTYRPSNECEFDDLTGYSSTTVILLGILVITVLIFSLAVIYYNVHLVKYGTAPFAVPNVLPEFLFPRDNTSGRRTIDHTLDNVFTPENRNRF